MANVLWLSIIWIAPLVCFLLANEAKFKKNIVVGVTLPYEAREDEGVKEQLQRFRRAEWAVCALLVAVAAACWALAGESMTIWFIWVDLCILLPYLPYVRTNRALKALKKERGWGHPASSQNIRVNTSAINTGRWISAWAFLPAVLLCLVPLIFNRYMWVLNVTMAGCCALFWVLYRYCYRNKSEMVDDNVELTRVLTQVRRYNWSRTWLILSYSMALLSIGASLTIDSPFWNTALYIVFTVVVVAVSLWVELSVRRVQEKLTAQSGQDWYVDEDDKWIGGILYYNTNDSRLIINSRVGINTGINAAHPAGKVLTVLLIVLLLSLPLNGHLIGGGELELYVAEVGAEMDDTPAVVASNGLTKYEIALDNIKTVQLLTELPDNMMRNVGTAMPNLLKGDFSASEIGAVKVCLDPTMPPFLLIETESGTHYLLGSRETGDIELVYERIAE